jgi:predicted NACHT family NTPase
MAAEVVAAKGAIAAAEKVGSKLVELGIGPVSSAVAKWKNKRNKAALGRALSHLRYLKTILHVDAEVDLSTFYYPSRLEVKGARHVVHSLDDLPERRNFVVQGTVGQGKSIFLRYLAIQELKRGKRLPLFFELRRVTLYGGVKQGLNALLKTYGFEVSDALFHFYANTGLFVLFLDGFDELAEEVVPAICNEIEELARSFPTLQIVVSSRPNGGIESSAQFRTLKLADLGPADHRPFLQKIISDSEQIDLLMGAIQKSPQDIRQLLRTPLTLSLLVLVYRSENDIPPTLAGFYDHLFWAILARHEKSKLGGTRKRKSGLGDRELEEFFQALCFVSKIKGARSFSVSTFSQLARTAQTYLKLDCEPANLLEDLTKHVCLLTQDGLEYKYVHQSVQEFFAASFVKASNDEFARKFYDRLSEPNKWRGWEQELSFLVEIDRYRYLKLFYVPLCTKFLSKLPQERIVTLAEASALLSQVQFHIRISSPGDIAGYVSFGNSTYVENYFQLSVYRTEPFRRLFEAILKKYQSLKEKEPSLFANEHTYVEATPDVIREFLVEAQIVAVVKTVVEDIASKVGRAIASIAREEQKVLMLE